LDSEAKASVAPLKVNWDAEKDEKLLHCMAHGDAEEQKGAFDAFYRRHTPYFHAICYTVLERYTAKSVG